ncbi:MAG TPA: acyl-CoA dehydrogenase family protein [Labilithrix sp.]|nr:acyl-CoA dehydrogenase family protein [Labilithrix sp.]
MSNASRTPNDPLRPRTSTFERVTAQPLRVLTMFGGAELTERLGLRKPAEKVLYTAAKAAAQVMAMSGKPKPKSKEAPARLARASASSRFDLRPTEEQEMFRASARRFAEDILRPAAAAADSAAAPPADVLERSQELALAGLAVPEALGGVAETSSIVTSTLIIEELARGDMGLALAVLAPVGVANAIVAWGDREQQERWLPKLTGDRFVPSAFALLEPTPGFDPSRPRTGAIRSKSGGFTLYGEKSLVPLAERAEVFLVAAEIRGVGPRLFVVPRDRPGLTVEPQPAMGLRGAGLGRIRLDGVHVDGDALLGGEEGALRGFSFAPVIDRARIAWGAMAVGGAKAVLDHVLGYVNERKAFGEPISNRQSVAFLVADMAIELEGMRLMLQRAASLADRGEDVSRYTSMMRMHCATKGMKIGTDGVQLLGGHGFVKDHPVERWYRDLRAIAVLEGALVA